MKNTPYTAVCEKTDLRSGKISTILRDNFMTPLHLSAYRVAKEIGVPVSRIQDILHDRRTITADTALRLSRYLGVSDRYFLDLQTEFELEAVREDIREELEQIIPIRR